MNCVRIYRLYLKYNDTQLYIATIELLVVIGLLNAYTEMALQVTLGNKDYTFLVGYQDQQIYRAAFNKLVDKVFNISFEA